MNPFRQSDGGIQEDRFARLIELGSTLLSELDLEAVLGAVVEAAQELTGARYAALGVLNPDRTELERFIYRGIDEETRRQIGSLPRGRGLLGELIRKPQPLRLRDVNEHPHAYGYPPGHPQMRSFLGVPVRVRDATFGNLYLTEKEGAEEFDESDEKAVRTLATWAGVAIENARLYTSLAEREADLQQALRRAETSVEIARTVGGETDVERVLDLTVKRARALVDARALLVLLRRGEELYVAARAGSVGREVAEMTVPVEGSVFGEAMRERTPRRLEGIRTQTEHGLRERLDAEWALVVPLVFRGYAVGTLVALDREAGGSGGFDEEDSRLLGAFATSAATAVATAQTVEADRLQQQVEIGERERQHWARELHDETLQGLAAIRISLAAALQGSGEERAARIEAAATEAVDRLEGQINDLSRLINDLQPAALERLGLEPAIVALAEEGAARNELEVAVEVDVAAKLSSEEERSVYRLVQEALNNVIKHADAEHVSVSARWDGREVRIAVADDGRGFDAAGVSSGHGLRGMSERVESLGGEITVSSEPGVGTKVEARLPVGASRPKPDSAAA